MKNQEITIAIIGGSVISAEMEQIAQEVGNIVAKVGGIVVCGGLLGSMEAACKGAKEAGGTTIGLLPGTDKADANDYVDIALPTTIGFARNAMVAASGDIVIALAGSHGTNSEISYALVYQRPVYDMGGWNREGMIPVKDLEDLEKQLGDHITELKNARIT